MTELRDRQQDAQALADDLWDFLKVWTDTLRLSQRGPILEAYEQVRRLGFPDE